MHELKVTNTYMINTVQRAEWNIQPNYIKYSLNDASVFLNSYNGYNSKFKKRQECN